MWRNELITGRPTNPKIFSTVGMLIMISIFRESIVVNTFTTHAAYHGIVINNETD
jgi:hypothetical protein